MSIVDTGKIVRLRGDRTREEATVSMGISGAVLHKIESGKMPNPRIETLKMVADHYKVTIDDLLLK